MFIGEISKTIRREVVYPYLNEDGEYQESKFNVWVKRISFRERAGEAFKKQFEEIQKDELKLAEVIAPLISDWELFADKECTEKCPITADFLKEQDAFFIKVIADAAAAVLLETTDPKKTPANSANGSELTANADNPATN